MALSKLYGRPLVVYNEQDDSVQEQVFPSVEEDERPTSTDELRDPVSLGTPLTVFRHACTCWALHAHMHAHAVWGVGIH